MSEQPGDVSIEVRPTVPGSASGAALVLDEALSLWGGIDPEAGVVVDRHHPQVGESFTGKIVIMPHGRGSSSASSVLAEMVRAGTAPAAFVLHEPDEIIALGSLAAEAVYGNVTPVVVCSPEDAARIATGDQVRLEGSTLLVIRPS